MSERSMTIQDLLVGILKRLYKISNPRMGKNFKFLPNFKTKKFY